MNNEICILCKKKMRNSLHKVWSSVWHKNMPCHKHCEDKQRQESAGMKVLGDYTYDT